MRRAALNADAEAVVLEDETLMPLLRTWHWLLVCALMGLLLVAPAAAIRADDVADGIEAARIKSKAGKHSDALAELDALLLVHAADPRVQYQRALILKDLKRMGDAADAIEAAQAAMEAYEKGGGEDAAVLAIKAGLKTEAASLLKYRAEARKLLGDYFARGLEAARKLLHEKRPVEAAYVLEEIAGASPENTGGEEFTTLAVEVKDALRKQEPEGK
jgi:hypothetical protein